MSDDVTAKVIERYQQAFRRHDPSLLDGLIADDCVLENSQPRPNGARYVGAEALAFWKQVAATENNNFETEEVIIAGDRAITRWTLRWGPREEDSIRGCNVMRVRDGQIVEGFGYVKG
jgi:ketosteroid isomerase-like protein